MRILAIDVGKRKSVACDYNSVTAEHTFKTLATTKQALHDLVVEKSPDRVVIEVGLSCGWIVDLCNTLGASIAVANPSHEAWRWKNVKTKTDRTDALKLAKLSAAEQLPTVCVPSTTVRQWRSLIGYRHKLIRARVRVKNSIRAILMAQGESLIGGKGGWTDKAIKELRTKAKPVAEAGAEDLWRGQLHVAIQHLEDVTQLIDQVTAKLNDLAEKDQRVAQLRSIPGVGARLAEVVVAVIDDAKRFENGKQVGAYAGLAPKQYQSGDMDRKGGISGHGNNLLRALLVEVAWLGRRHNPHLRRMFDQCSHGSKARRKVAVVAVARKLLVICWAMLRDGTRWQPPTLAAPT